MDGNVDRLSAGVRKLSPRSIGPFKILARVGPVAYKLELPEHLQGIHSTFHVSNLQKCLADENLIIPLDEIRLDDKLHFIEEPVEIVDRKISSETSTLTSLLKEKERISQTKHRDGAPLSHSEGNANSFNLTTSDTYSTIQEIITIAINIEPVEIIFSTPPTSPHPFFDSLKDLPLRTTDPPPTQPTFDSIECLAIQPPSKPKVMEMEPPLPPLPPHLLPFS
ncbi:hypothetical protein Tco_0585789 [Tanacetum coccineum]